MEDTETVEQTQPQKKELTPAQALQVAIDSVNEIVSQRVSSLAGFAQLLGSDNPRHTKQRDLAKQMVAQETSAVSQALHTIVGGLENAKDGRPTWVKTLANGVTVFAQNPDPHVK